MPDPAQFIYQSRLPPKIDDHVFDRGKHKPTGHHEHHRHYFLPGGDYVLLTVANSRVRCDDENQGCHIRFKHLLLVNVVDLQHAEVGLIYKSDVPCVYDEKADRKMDQERKFESRFEDQVCVLDRYLRAYENH
jgi:hypothetical protein